MEHPTHKLKAWVGDYKKSVVFCEVCGKEENETEIKEPCPGKFIVKRVDTKTEPK